MLRRIARAILEVITTSIRRRPAFFAVLGAILVFSTVLIKDNIAEAIRSNIQGVEFAKQFYELHIEDIDLNGQLNEIGDSIEELKLSVSTKGVPNALQETMNTAIQNHNEAVKDIKLIEATNADTEELVKHISDSQFFFLYSNGDERIVRSSLKLSTRSLDDLRSDIKTLKSEWNDANRLVSVPNHQFAPEEMAKIDEAYKKFSHDANAAAIQAESLQMQSLGDRERAVKVAGLYGQLLEDEDSVCKWAIVVLVILGALLGLLSQLAGFQEGAAKAL
jgi:chromosome segregation ATPase